MKRKIHSVCGSSNKLAGSWVSVLGDYQGSQPNLKSWKTRKRVTFSRQEKIRILEKKFKTGTSQWILLAQERKLPVCCKYNHSQILCWHRHTWWGKNGCKRRRGPLHACVIYIPVVLLVYVYSTVQTSVFSFTVFTAITVLCNSIKDCLKLEISQTKYHGIMKMHRKYQEILFAWNAGNPGHNYDDAVLCTMNLISSI